DAQAGEHPLLRACAPSRIGARGRTCGSAGRVPVTPMGHLAADLRALLVGESEVDAGPDAGVDDVVSQLREARELPRHAARRGATERRSVPAVEVPHRV